MLFNTNENRMIKSKIETHRNKSDTERKNSFFFHYKINGNFRNENRCLIFNGKLLPYEAHLKI